MSMMALLAHLTLVVQTTAGVAGSGLGETDAGARLPKAQVYARVAVGAQGPQQIMVRVRIKEIGLVDLEARGAGWGERQPALGQQLDSSKVPPDGGSLSLLVVNTEAEKLQGWLNSGVRAERLCVTSGAGTYVELIDVALEAIRRRAEGRSLIILSAPNIRVLTGERATACDLRQPL